jgi:hypothetical protein
MLRETYTKRHVQEHIQAGHWWLTLVILASWETEVRRIAVPDQSGQIDPKTISPK